jgi:hypothetical protein
VLLELKLKGALSRRRRTSRLVVECLDALFALASLNEVTLV